VRRRIVLVVLATTSLVVVAFALPLGALVRSVARDRAVSAAQARPAVARAGAGPRAGSRPRLERGDPGNTGTGNDGRLDVWLPGGERVGDSTQSIGTRPALARRQRSSAR
jgi:hypothetical protein